MSHARRRTHAAQEGLEKTKDLRKNKGRYALPEITFIDLQVQVVWDDCGTYLSTCAHAASLSARVLLKSLSVSKVESGEVGVTVKDSDGSCWKSDLLVFGTLPPLGQRRQEKPQGKHPA